MCYGRDAMHRVSWGESSPRSLSNAKGIPLGKTPSERFNKDKSAAGFGTIFAGGND